MMHSVRIISGGQASNTRILDSNDREIPCSELLIHMVPNADAEIKLSLATATVQLEGKAEIVLAHPVLHCMMPIKKIVFADDSEWEPK